MRVIRVTEPQTHAIRNLMLNQDQISMVLGRLQLFRVQWIKDLDISQAKELISDLVENMERRKS